VAAAAVVVMAADRSTDAAEAASSEELAEAVFSSEEVSDNPARSFESVYTAVCLWGCGAVYGTGTGDLGLAIQPFPPRLQVCSIKSVVRD